ncbi:MAG: glycosyltransferase, partial [Bacteroidetes bacterium]|nr:glycosyltransferase [Bacteroidota bacterium]
MDVSDKHVLYLAGWYPNRKAPTNGIFIQRHAESVAKHLHVSALHVKSDERITDNKLEIVASEINRVFTVNVYYKKITTRLPVISGLLKLKRYIEASYAGYAKVVEKNGRPDILHLYIIYPAGIFAKRLLKQLNIPLVISEQWSGYLPEDGNYKGFHMKWLTKLLVKKAAKIIVVSKNTERSMLAHGLRSNYRIIANTVNPDIFYSETKETGKPIKFIHVSTINDREKNISGILQAVSGIENLEYRIVIVGDSDEKQDFEVQAQELGLTDKVEFKGFLDPGKVADQMREADFFLMFSNYEGLPCVLLEAMQCGLPIISSDVGGIPEFIDSDKGVLVGVRNESELKKATETPFSGCGVTANIHDLGSCSFSGCSI